MLRPAVSMGASRTIVVGIRGLVDDSGAAVDAPAGFEALRDGASSNDLDISRQQEAYESLIFPTLSAAGFAREELQLAWSFSTGSVENTRQKMEWMRADALSRIGETGPPYTLTEIEEEIRIRDESDMAVGPLADAHRLALAGEITELDTTGMDIDAVLMALLVVIRRG